MKSETGERKDQSKGDFSTSSLYDQSRGSLKNHYGKSNPDRKNVPEKSDEGQEGLNFIANWIEVVLARLEIHIDNVNVIINDHEVSKTALRMHLSKAVFYNTNPRSVSSR